MAMPRVALRLHGGMTAAESVRIAKAAEAAGLSSVWFAENPFNRGVLPAASAVALSTERIGVGIGVFNPYNRHPTLMAMEIGALDELSGGRAVLGIGSGLAGAVRRMGLAPDLPIAGVRDAVAIVRAMLAGEVVDHAGRVFEAKGARLGYDPPRRDLPLYVAARGDQSLDLCGRIADGLMISNMCPPAFTRRAVARARAAADRAGRNPVGAVVQYVPCAIGGDRAETRTRAKRALAAMIPDYWALAERVPAARRALLAAPGVTAEDFAAASARLGAGEPAEAVVSGSFLRAFAIEGTGPDCVRQIETYAEAGVSEIALTMIGPSPAEDVVSLGRFLS